MSTLYQIFQNFQKYLIFDNTLYTDIFPLFIKIL